MKGVHHRMYTCTSSLRNVIHALKLLYTRDAVLNKKNLSQRAKRCGCVPPLVAYERYIIWSMNFVVGIKFDIRYATYLWIKLNSINNNPSFAVLRKCSTRSVFCELRLLDGNCLFLFLLMYIGHSLPPQLQHPYKNQNNYKNKRILQNIYSSYN